MTVKLRRWFCLLGALLVTLCAHTVYGQRAEFIGCSSAEQSRIRKRLKWIRSYQDLIIDEARARDADIWSGRSEQRFRALLKSKIFQIECSRSQKHCGSEVRQISWHDSELPAPHRYPITVCVDELLENDALTLVLVRLLGHQVLLNADQKECELACERPRLAQLLTQVTRALLTGEAFSLEWCLTACAPPRLDGSVEPLPPGTRLNPPSLERTQRPKTPEIQDKGP